jgi:hypothetical protein|tara:strand:- start:55 stop:540 length:486 start_codon:yes stop_codon:yes gene_type:complete
LAFIRFIFSRTLAQIELTLTLSFNASMDSLKNRRAFANPPALASSFAVDDPAVDFSFAFDLGSPARADADAENPFGVSPRFCASESVSYLASRSARSKQSDTSTPCVVQRIHPSRRRRQSFHRLRLVVESLSHESLVTVRVRSRSRSRSRARAHRVDERAL